MLNVMRLMATVDVMEIHTVRGLGLTRVQYNINLLTPNVNYSGRTASLTSKVAFYIFIQQI